jgi:hypothetical protein
MEFTFTNINIEHCIFGTDEEPKTDNTGRRNAVSHIYGLIRSPYYKTKIGIQFFLNS